VRSKAVEYEPGILQLAMPDHNDQSLVARKVIQWYKKQAVTDFTRRLEIFSSKLGVQFTSLTISNAASRWGSCNSKKEIRLNWRLLQAPPHLINYVVCHELAHIKEMNHSAKFWATVASIYPDYKVAEKELKALSATLHRF
jgi:predicted metal-dependent hydrolase